MKDFFNNSDDISRKSFLLHAAQSTLGVSLAPSFLWSADDKAKKVAAAKKATCERVIFLYMKGGMSQTDTFDPKEKASIGGKSKPVKTKSPELLLSDKLPKLAQQAMDLSVIR